MAPKMATPNEAPIDRRNVAELVPTPTMCIALAVREMGLTPGEAVHVGDSLENDVEGARAAGIRPLLLVRGGEAPAGVEVIRSLAELPSIV